LLARQERSWATSPGGGGFFALGLTIIPRIVKWINKSQFNVFASQSPVAYAIAVLFGYCVAAGALDVSLVFAAFLAGFAVVYKKRKLFTDALDSIGKMAFAFLFLSILQSSD
jgi:Kef-type K+ transport system membrane component KefB